MTDFPTDKARLIEKRRLQSIAALKAMDSKEWAARYQQMCDTLYWKNGPCCAGCDHWQSEMGMNGRCTAGPILSGEDVMKSMGVEFSSYTPAPGHPFTNAWTLCGLFKDDFDWSELPDEYLKAIGARP